MTELRDRLNGAIESVLLPLIAPDAEHICIIDPPGHPNVGDGAILLGELDFLARHFPRATLAFYDVHSYTPEADRFIDQASLLLLHGGGNFGDIWPPHHQMRTRILDRFSHKRIIQLPQSISFSDPAAAADTARLIDRQSDFTLLVRDRSSQAWAEKHFQCPIALAPDMAFAMRPFHREPSAVDYFCLLRTDKEAIADHSEILRVIGATGRSFEADDWLRETRTLVRQLDRVSVKLTRASAALTVRLQTAAFALRRRYAEQRVKIGINLLSRGRAVIADRLHAHILCCMLDIPQVVFDSVDGKISAFHGAWTSALPNVRMASSPRELARQLTEVLPT